MNLGLVLTGGGARAAYQVGALRALAEVVGAGPSPFDVFAGISAGAINTVALATGADDFAGTVARLAETWSGLTPDRVYRTGALGLARIGTRWIMDLSAGGIIGKSGINYLLDSAPLRALLEATLPFRQLRRHLRARRVRGLAVSATNYHTGAGVTFYDGAQEIRPWTRSTRLGVRTAIAVDHVMASAAIPVFFPPVRIGQTFYGDGCVRMNYPMSPALHLGADRILAIGVRHPRVAELGPEEPEDGARRLPVSEIAGVLMNAVMLDSLDSDAERLWHTNRTLSLIPAERLRQGETDLRIVPALLLRPSQDLGRLAADEYGRFPGMLRYLLKGIGATGQAGEDLLSYLAFEPIYIKRVMDLGYADTVARRPELEAFLAGEPVAEARDLVLT